MALRDAGVAEALVDRAVAVPASLVEAGVEIIEHA
jgi:hypothetical protein